MSQDAGRGKVPKKSYLHSCADDMPSCKGAEGMQGAVGPARQAVPPGEGEQRLLAEAEDVIDILHFEVEEALQEAAVDSDRRDAVRVGRVAEDDGVWDLVVVARAVGEVIYFALGRHAVLFRARGRGRTWAGPVQKRWLYMGHKPVRTKHKKKWSTNTETQPKTQLKTQKHSPKKA